MFMNGETMSNYSLPSSGDKHQDLQEFSNNIQNNPQTTLNRLSGVKPHDLQELSNDIQNNPQTTPNRLVKSTHYQPVILSFSVLFLTTSWTYWVLLLCSWNQFFLAFIVLLALYIIGTLIFLYALLKFSKPFLILALAFLSSIIRLWIFVIQRVPFLERLTVIFGKVAFKVCYYFFVFVEMRVRSLLKSYFGIHHGATKVEVSIVNCFNVDFSGFDTKLFTNNTQYSQEKAHSLSIAAKLAYEKTEIVKYECRSCGFERVKIIRWKTTKGFVASTPDMILVSFSGTHPLDLTNLLNDIKMGLVYLPGMGHVHEGFVDALGLREKNFPKFSKNSSCFILRRLFSNIVKLVVFWVFGMAKYYVKLRARHEKKEAYSQAFDQINRLYKEKERPIWITGHSLGGALAMLFGTKLVKDNPHMQNTYVYTFGQPRLGDEQFAEFVSRKLSNRIFRFVYHNDFVPRVPLSVPSWLAKAFPPSSQQSPLGFLAGVSTQKSTYVHTGQHIYINKCGRVVTGANTKDILLLRFGIYNWLKRSPKESKEKRKESQLRRLARIFLPFYINDHFIDEYIYALAQPIPMIQPQTTN